MKRIIANEVSGYFLQHGLISKQQHGFLTRRSTVTNLVETHNDWILAVNTRQCVTVAYKEYKKAFDSVCHNKLFNRVVNVWNNLPANDVNFKSSRALKTFLSNIDLIVYLRK